MNILGINAAYHESAAALVVDGQLVHAVEEERFNRRKHGKPALVGNPDELPLQAIGDCLAQAGLRADELDAVAYAFSPALRRSQFRLDPRSRPGDWGSAEGEATFLDHLDHVPRAVARALGRDPEHTRGWLHFVPHHLAHAASAYHAAGWARAAVLVVDGIGEAHTGLCAHGVDAGITELSALHFPHSLGFLWEKLCSYLGFSEYDACKVMGMAGYGDPAAWRAALSGIAAVNDDGRFRCNEDLLCYRNGDMAPLESILGPVRARRVPLEQRHFDIAAALQEFTEEALLAIARRLRRETGEPRLCYAGGVALNCAANRRLIEAQIFDEIFVPSAPHDAGTAIGAAWQLSATLTGNRPAARRDAYLGPEFDDAQVAVALQASDLSWERVHDIQDRVAQLLAGGAIVAWFQGRMEFGPRALGNRSLLADPRDAAMRERMNHLVKRRESFRPFAPSVLAEQAQDWFDMGPWMGALHELMLVTHPIRPARRGQVPAVAHVDGTARVQIVRRETNPGYHGLIERFAALTGVPMLLNTSFNDNEPIVCSPADALRTFTTSPIDALALGNHLVLGKRP